MRQPTAEQKAIIDQTSGSFSVLASAGSGKTFVVTERYLRLIKEGYRPSQILTITFTRKAAAEMKSRVVNRLRQEGLNIAAQEAETGPIQTIHSFCERILRENSIAAGLDPQFDLVSEGEGDRIKQNALRIAISESELENEDVAYFLSQFVGSNSYGSQNAYSEIGTLVLRLLNHFRSSEQERSFYETLYASPYQYLKTTEELIKAQLPVEIQATLQTSSGSWDEVAQAELARLKLKMKFPWLKDPIPVHEQENGARLICGLVNITLRVWEIYESELRKKQYLDFNHLERKAVRLLEQNSGVRARLRDQYPYVMVDEAQDLSPIQHRLFESLQGESKVLIGDDKQSIYLFRYADVAQFRRVADENARFLTQSFRMESGVRSFVDDVFDGQFDGRYRRMSTDQSPHEGVDVWSLSAPFFWEELAKLVEENRIEGRTAILVRKGQYVKQIAIELRKRGLTVSTTGGTDDYFGNLEIRDIANTLASLTDENDSYSHLAMLRSPVVGISMDAIISLVRTGESIRSGVLSYQFEHESDRIKIERFRQWFVPLVAVAGRIPAWEILSSVVAQSPLLENLALRVHAEKKIANVRKLLQLAVESSEYSTEEFVQMLRDLRSIGTKSTDAPLDDENDQSIVVSTIHSAKGLEWDHVILADLMGKTGGGNKGLQFDFRSGLIGLSKGMSNTYASRWVTELNKKAEKEEQMRLLYVALTRAKKRLSLLEWGTSPANQLKVIQSNIGAEAFASLQRVSAALGD